MVAFVAFFGILGLIVGSFLTVVVRRVGSGETIFWGRSHCPRCHAVLGWSELLPVLSFFAQNGRCRSCGGAIGRIYPAIELITAVLLAALGWAALRGGILPAPPFFSGALPIASGWPQAFASFLYYAVFASVAVAISGCDIARRIIPAALVLPLMILGAFAHAAAAFHAGSIAALIPVAAAGVSAFFLFWSLWFFSHGRAMGRGDADVALAIVLYIGPASAIGGILFAFWIGAAFGILAIATGKLQWRSRVPFAPFLFGGALLALVFSSQTPSHLPFGYVF